ncbi:MAG: hypothetical protein JF626_00295 [Polaromonas sp.]|nr:hypothetical protein [Polaromonas sp.]
MHLSIQHLFGFKSHTKPAIKASHPPREGPATIADGSANSLRRQLIQVLLKDSMRRHGIPMHWLDCQMLLVSSRSRGEGMYLRIVMKHWDLRMLTYALAFEKSLVMDITRFEPHARDWLYGISWQFDVGDSCPYRHLPDRHLWESHSIKTSAPGDVKQDLARMFAIRDADMLMRGADAAYPAGNYDKTQPQVLPPR